MRTPDAFGSSTHKTLRALVNIAYRIPKTHTFGALEASLNLLTKNIWIFTTPMIVAILDA